MLVRGWGKYTQTLLAGMYIVTKILQNSLALQQICMASLPVNNSKHISKNSSYKIKIVSQDMYKHHSTLHNAKHTHTHPKLETI